MIDTETKSLHEDLPAELLSAISLKMVLTNARRIAKRDFNVQPNWALAMDIFGIGSSYANWLCRCLDVDPDATEIRPLPRVKAEETQEPDQQATPQPRV